MNSFPKAAVATQVLQTQCLNTTEIFSLTVLESRSLKPRCGGMLSLNALEAAPFTPLLACGGLSIWRAHSLEKKCAAGKEWRQEEKGITENEVVVWHRQLDGHEFEQAPGVDDGQVSLACCSIWGHKESGTTEWPNWLTDNIILNGKKYCFPTKIRIRQRCLLSSLYFSFVL